MPLFGFTDEELFPACNAVVPAWLLLVIVPEWNYTRPIVIGTALLFCALYAGLLVGAKVEMADFQTIQGVRAALANPSVTLLAWVHYIAYDVLTGLAIVTHNNNCVGLNRLIMAPVLFFALMFGPVGFLSYAVLAGVKSIVSPKKVSVKKAK